MGESFCASASISSEVLALSRLKNRDVVRSKSLPVWGAMVFWKVGGSWLDAMRSMASSSCRMASKMAGS